MCENERWSAVALGGFGATSGKTEIVGRHVSASKARRIICNEGHKEAEDIIQYSNQVLNLESAIQGIETSI